MWQFNLGAKATQFIHKNKWQSKITFMLVIDQQVFYDMSVLDAQRVRSERSSR